MAELREIFDRNVVQSYVLERDPMAETKFTQSGAFESDPRLRSLLTSGSQTFEVPYITPVDGRLEANYGNTVYTDVAMPRTIKGGKMQGRSANMNEGFLESNLERILLGQSPLQMMANMINDVWRQQLEYRAIATAIGIRNYDQANGKALSTDVSKTTGANEASGFNVDAYLEVEGTMDAMYRGRGIMVVHPQVATKMRKQNLIEQVTTSANLPPVQIYNGRTLIESDNQTKIGTGQNAQYISYLMGAGSFSADVVTGHNDLELERTAATGNGSGHTALWTRRRAIVHPQGFSFVLPASELTGGTANEALSPSWTDLTKSTAWNMDADAKNVPFRFLVTNL